MDTQVFEDIATVTQWDEDYYHPAALRLYDRAVADMLHAMGVEPDERVLDAGCGPGVHSIRVARAGLQVHAVDVSNAMLDQARARVEAAGLSDRVTFEQQNLLDLDLPDASFRCVFSWGVVIHIPEIEQALDELVRVTRPGGYVALFVTNRWALDHWIEGAARRLLRRPLDMRRRPMGDGVQYDLNGNPLWLWRIDARALTRHMADRRCRLVHRRVGEFTELQRRCPTVVRPAVIRLNRLMYALHAPSGLGATRLLVYRKDDRASPGV